METAILSKRIWLYIINTILYHGIGFCAALPFLLILKIHTFFYIMIGIGFSASVSFLLSMMFLVFTHGYTFGSALFKVKYVANDGNQINKKQMAIRSVSESVAILALLDLIYFIINRTERGVIDRLSDSFAIDMTR